MKKTIMLAAAAVAMLGMAACGNKNCNGGSCANNGTKGDRTEVYTGIMPMADVEGMRYTLTLEFDDDDNDGDYKLIETVVQSDSTAVGGFKDGQSFHSEGDFYIKTKDGKKYYELKKDMKDSGQGSLDTPAYFLVDSDSTITMTGADLIPAAAPDSILNYTLRLSK